MAWSRTSRHERGYGWVWEKIRARVMVRDKGLCQPCLRKGHITSATEVNHIKPKAEGGTDSDRNLEAICHPCHVNETARQQGKRPMVTTGLDGWPEER